MTEAKSMIETIDLWYEYGSIQALRGVNFRAEKGRITVLMGRNGAGKTTLLMHFNGLLRPRKGEVRVDGKPIKYDRKGLMEVRKKVGFVFQNPDDQIVAPTVWQDVAFGCENLGLSKEDVAERVSMALKWVSLEGFENRLCNTLSGGEKRKVAIAGVVAMNPDCIIMDEPTAGLDGIGVRDVVKTVLRLRDEGKTLVISTHDADFAMQVGDHFVVMDQGKIVFEGDCLEPEIAELYGLRVYNATSYNPSRNKDSMHKQTKDEVAGILFMKIKPENHHVFADIGSGSGKISIIFSPYVRKVFAVESDPEAFEESKKNLAGFENVEVLNMDGKEFLRNYDYDIVFFGGTKEIDEMLEIACRKAKRIVVNAARIEVASMVIEKMKELGVFREALIVNISKSYELAGKTAFRGLNPVFMIVGGKED
ncbi:ATP-binding cassette domain-containing protein [Archaeoglobus veneficus]|uniref:ABC transporter ATP-binding protein n=1 Tax=Archaeoglobus veneficus (strain DSM 11195 / SNP6) TaxID=693661 RepID=F2KS04_ARCVS|nr:ATP-binding cassette domain-containing protein [Archaeoglobus veneficus]AEA46845.1 cobalt ABC transporter, ATPase subunit [Archaeoglobus veneficus SNP6]